MAEIPEYFGSMVFDDRAMRAWLAPDVYAALNETIASGKRLDKALATQVAAAMRDWALEKGATHYTHWFQPMTGVTAEKHESFLTPVKDGGALLDFSGSELVQGEADGSSFPSGGLRVTFEARGYTVWDANSYAFIKDNTLCIPTAFCSSTGDALDHKTPLLRSMEAINQAALRIVRLFGMKDVHSVTPSVGAEQEYFLMDKEMFYSRKDLVYTNRTLFGARPPKGQEMDDHYYGVIKPRVKEFMAELDRELWALGIPAKTEHKEVAPGQHELANVYSSANVATDQNQLTMEIMQKVADKYGFVCVLHEKPFQGVNGSGKHDNWSLSTDTGKNLLSPGKTPEQNWRFLTFLMATIQAVDEYQDLLRISVASAANDHRLGASEAPPAVISIFLGDELTHVLESLANDDVYATTQKREMGLGTCLLPEFLGDITDRNRTSPFAFTGNKFEFRMVGSSASVGAPNTMLNSAVATILNQYADELEKAADFDSALHALLKNAYLSHKRIIFNGNGYDDNWIREASTVRGLSNYPTTPDCLPHLLDEKNVQMLTNLHVYSKSELESRLEIHTENYVKTVEIEARTMLTLTRKRVLPAVSAYLEFVAGTAFKKEHFGLSIASEKKLMQILTEAEDGMTENLALLEADLENAYKMPFTEASFYIRDNILPLMDTIRHHADSAEVVTDKEYWPFPSYGDLFFSIH